MSRVYSWLLVVLWVGVVHAQEPNDHIFPEAAGASRSIHFDKKGFFIHGRRTFLVSAGMEYARVPRALWADRLLRLQRAGFNCVEIYAFWNFHEPREGQFRFTGEQDLDAFLRLVARMGMYAIMRVGPYDCAEWDNGGYPLWLKFKPRLRVREHNAEFEKYVGRFFDRLLPIVATNQIHRGGAVIMVQLENEHPLGWGIDKPNGYFDFLQRKALQLGIEVPYFFSGLHHSSDPAGDVGTLDDPNRPNPWFTTEFWSVWFNGYGSGPSEARLYEERTWKIIRGGGGGYNYYMAHGGSNFGYTNNDEDAASYDYGAAVGQAGDLRPIYYSFKRTALFARSFATELAERRVHFSDSGMAIDGYVSLRGDSAKFLGRVLQGKTTTLMVYGAAGSRVKLTFAGATVEAVVPAGREPAIYRAGKNIRILVMNTEVADRTWVIPYEGVDYIVCGVKYVGPVWVREGRMSMVAEDTVGALVYSAAGVQRVAGRRMPVGRGGRSGWSEFDSTGVVGNWVRQDATGAAAPDYDDRLWKYETWPLQMGADGDTTADAWYRAHLAVDTAGVYTLLVGGADRGRAYVDGKPVDTFNIKDGAIPLGLTAGKHVLAVFTAHDGRDKLPAYLGPIDEAARKGLFGRALLVKGAPAVRNLTDWRVKRAAAATFASELEKGPPADGDTALWKRYKIGEDIFDKKQGAAWFETILPDMPASAQQAELSFASVDENATVFINGRRIARHEGWNSPFSMVIDRIDTMERPIRLTVFIENYSNEGGIDQAVHFSPWVSPVEVKGWRMKGGVDDTPGQRVAGPCRWETIFTLPVNPRWTTVWRVVPAGLGHGSVWVNGHNLGRYPEKIPVDGLYIPECWLVPGANRLVIFDEDGASSAAVRVQAEVAASRPVELLQ